MFEQPVITKKAWIIFTILSILPFINVVFIISLKIHDYTNEKVIKAMETYTIPWAIFINFLLFVIVSGSLRFGYSPI